MKSKILKSTAQRPSTEEPFNLRHHAYALACCGFFVLGAVLYGYVHLIVLFEQYLMFKAVMMVSLSYSLDSVPRLNGNASLGTYLFVLHLVPLEFTLD